ncbi:RNA polymerase sigma factor [Pedobacter frigoris]|uniref:Sigma-70 family RNA polymerase sigma factor n=1 Tax=Pedobacter frigoris TaxID=2571272 RepID=A0A4V6WN66_9SPHI|nr:sigma-70 family RNA polymerase sigma factor [Pedobacter frigoris]TKC09242.1 sigma-70 family RNA polymerase sigma factor [Pedobacter frigoris]
MAAYRKYTDQEILLLAREDREKAFDIAFNQYWPVLYHHAFKKVQSKDLAKDIVQDVFIKMWDNISKLAEQDSLLPYLYTVLRNNTLKQFEKDNVRLKYAMNRVTYQDDFEVTSHHLLISKELQAIIDDEMSRMPARMKEIYELKKEQNFSIKQIAEQLGLSEQTVKNQLHTASNRLKERIKVYDPGLISVALMVSGLYGYVN